MSFSGAPSPVKPFGNFKMNSGMAFFLIIFSALLAFEMFNYSTTDYALKDLLGELRFAGIHWATILAVAFCGIDFAGIARLFTPQQGSEEPKEVWYLFGAWLLAATMNAVLTWWGVSMAVVNHAVASTSVMDAGTVTKIVPVFVAIMVWVIRILIIGSLSMAGDRLLWANRTTRPAQTTSRRGSYAAERAQAPVSSTPVSPRPTVARTAAPLDVPAPPSRPEPTYHSFSSANRNKPHTPYNDNSSGSRHL